MINRNLAGDDARPDRHGAPDNAAPTRAASPFARRRTFAAATTVTCALLGAAATRLTGAQTAAPAPSLSAPPQSQATPAVPAGMYVNPVSDRDRPDPDVLRADNAYWMTHTTGGPHVGWPLYKSNDLVHWTFVKHLLRDADGPDGPANKPAWMTDSFWATEIHQIRPRQFVLTFTSWSAQYKRLCVGIATATKITGPYTVQNMPLVTDTVSTLDSHIFINDNGGIYFYWKRDSDTGKGVGGTIQVRKMNRDATGWAAGSAAVVTLSGDAAATDPAAIWEKGLVEAPWTLKRGKFYYLFYSGAFIDTTYALGVARSASPTGPFTRCPGNPLLRSNAAWGGPGHGAFVRDKHGDYFHLYHARRQANPKAGRLQLLDRLYWNDDWPAFGDGGTPSTTPQRVPAL